MKSVALRFADFFGTIDFSDAAVTGEGNAAMVPPTLDLKRGMDFAADYVATPDAAHLLAQHNANATSQAADVAKMWGMTRCPSCGKYDFGDGCFHPGCKQFGRLR